MGRKRKRNSPPTKHSGPPSAGASQQIIAASTWEETQRGLVLATDSTVDPISHNRDHGAPLGRDG